VPLRTVQRDPLAVLDWQFLSNPADALELFTYRILSATAPGGEYIAEAYMLEPSHRWLWEEGEPRWY
jgi:hypothetical protein